MDKIKVRYDVSTEALMKQSVVLTRLNAKKYDITRAMQIKANRLIINANMSSAPGIQRLMLLNRYI